MQLTAARIWFNSPPTTRTAVRRTFRLGWRGGALEGRWAKSRCPVLIRMLWSSVPAWRGGVTFLPFWDRVPYHHHLAVWSTKLWPGSYGYKQTCVSAYCGIALYYPYSRDSWNWNLVNGFCMFHAIQEFTPPAHYMQRWNILSVDTVEPNSTANTGNICSVASFHNLSPCYIQTESWTKNELIKLNSVALVRERNYTDRVTAVFQRI
jgi:hypothetical protein